MSYMELDNAWSQNDSGSREKDAWGGSLAVESFRSNAMRAARSRDPDH